MWLKTVNIGKIALEHYQNGCPTWNMANAHAHWQLSMEWATSIVWVSGHAAGEQMDRIVDLDGG
jgi:hypothetical protein